MVQGFAECRVWAKGRKEGARELKNLVARTRYLSLRSVFRRKPLVIPDVSGIQIPTWSWAKAQNKQKKHQAHPYVKTIYVNTNVLFLWVQFSTLVLKNGLRITLISEFSSCKKVAISTNKSTLELIKSAFCALEHALKSGNKKNGCCPCGSWAIDCLLWLELKSTISILLNSVPHSNVIISWCRVSTDTIGAHPWPDFASVMLSDVSLTFQCPADKLWGDAFNLINAAQVQWPAHFGAVFSPQSNQHTKSSGLILLPHALIKMFTCALARNGLNLIWVMCGLSTVLISVGLAS